MQVNDYRDAIALDERREISPAADWRSEIGDVFAQLAGQSIDAPADQLLQGLHGLLATVDPFQLDGELMDRIESIDAAVTAERGVTDALDLPTIADGLSLWVGDITTLRVDAIVNAANHELLGCRQPNHACIDNAIHSAAGPRLRDDCGTIVGLLTEREPVGAAKITRAHALPSRFVLHTVGPQLRRGAQPTPAERAGLASCYRACLDTAAEVESIRTVAFCGISTGVFAYPTDQAATVALDTIDEWMATHPGRFDRLVIDCFKPHDAQIYEELLRDR